MASTALQTLGPNTKVALKEGNSWGDVILASLRDDHSDALPEAKVPVAKAIALSDKEKTALKDLAKKLDAVTWPSGRRKLNNTELRSMVELIDTEKNLKTLTERVEKALKTALFNHFDVIAEGREENPADPETSPRHKDGFYALPDTENGTVEGLAVKVTREVGSPSVALSAEALYDMVVAGEIDKALYLRLTRQVREIDEDAVFAAIKADPSVLPILRRATVITRAAQVSLNLRKTS